MKVRSVKIKFLIAIVLISVIPMLFFGRLSYNRIEELLVKLELEKVNVFHQEIDSTVNTYFSNALTDINYMSDVVASMDDLHDHEADEFERELEAMFYDFMNNHQQYDQLRLLNQNGMEVLRINNYDRTQLVPKNELQDKSDRYYYIEAKKLQKGKVYISPIDLNKENGEVELPHKGVVRFVKPLYFGDRVRYYLITNLNVNHLLEDVQSKIDRSAFSNTTLASSDGFYLYHPVREKAWGGPNDLNTGYSLVEDYSLQGGKIVSSMQSDYQIESRNSYFWHPIYIKALNERKIVVTTDIEKKVFLAPMDEFFRGYIVQSLWLVVVLVIVSYYFSKYLSSPIEKIAKAVTEIGAGKFDVALDIDSSEEIQTLAYEIKKMAFELDNMYQNMENRVRERTLELEHARDEMKRMAETDPLTGLYNRHYFNLYATRLADAKLNRVVFIVIDVNDFKYINDHYGHNVGDVVLVEVATMLRRGARDNDFVVRYGGDEFLVVLYNCDEAVAEKYIHRVQIAIDEWNENTEVLEHDLTISFGYDVYNGSRHLLDSINDADQKMYEHKAKLKKERGTLSARSRDEV